MMQRLRFCSSLALLVAVLGCNASTAPTGASDTAWDVSSEDAGFDAGNTLTDAVADAALSDARSSDARLADTMADDTTGDSAWVPTYPTKRVGIFYLAWHAYAADAMSQLAAADRLTVEDVIRSPSLHFSDILSKHGLLPQAASFHYHAKPKLGFYCLYRRRVSDPIIAEPLFVPDCPNISTTAATHARQLWDAGVDFVYVDVTNFPVFNTPSDVMGLRPLEVLLEEWTALRAAGHPTPQIAAWLPIPAVGAGETAMYKKVLELYANAAFADLLMTHQPTGQKVMFIVDSGASVDAANLAEIASHGILPVKLWGNLSDAKLLAGTAGWMQPCKEGGNFTSLVRPNVPCGQRSSPTTPLGHVLSVSASYQLAYASLAYLSSGQLGGLTLKKQFETAFSEQPDYLLINAWNEHIAQPQANTKDPAYGPLRRSMGESDVPDSDPGADWLWVDMYGRDLGRDIEPTEEDDGAAYALLQSCLRVYRSAHVSCTAQDQNTERCCQLGGGMHLVRSLRKSTDNGQMNTDHVLTLSTTERDSLVATGTWVEVCNLFYGPPGLCGGGTSGDGP
ncbi:MAG: hypothetical protein JRH20_23520, partial [Deltaproteobacteria bacterium]|nr:hypothetical protein [Deltaproteobacteria bacterium]